MVHIKVLEHAFYYIAGEFAVYRVLGGRLSMLSWLKEYSDIEQVITTESEMMDFVLNLMKYYQSYISDIKWPHKKRWTKYADSFSQM